MSSPPNSREPSTGSRPRMKWSRLPQWAQVQHEKDVAALRDAVEDAELRERRIKELEDECRCPACGCCTPSDADSRECGCDHPSCVREQHSLAEALADAVEARERAELAVKGVVASAKYAAQHNERWQKRAEAAEAERDEAIKQRDEIAERKAEEVAREMMALEGGSEAGAAPKEGSGDGNAAHLESPAGAGPLPPEVEAVIRAARRLLEPAGPNDREIIMGIEAAVRALDAAGKP